MDRNEPLKFNIENYFVKPMFSNFTSFWDDAILRPIINCILFFNWILIGIFPLNFPWIKFYTTIIIC